MLKTVLILSTVAILSACSNNTVNNEIPKQTIVEADDNMVKNCKFLGSVQRRSYTTFGNGFAPALSSAKAKGATHYVIANSESGMISIKRGTTTLRTYKC